MNKSVVGQHPETITVEQALSVKDRRAVNRRKFMIGLGIAGGSAVGMGLTGCSEDSLPGSTVLAAGPSEKDVLNFALNLEFLEATLYSFATQGTDLPASLLAGSGPVTGASSKLTFANQQITDVLNEVFFDEVSHITNLQNVLGSSKVARPALNLAAAGPVTAGNFITILRQFVDVGTTAYAGGISLLSGANLALVAQTLAVEGFHAGALRLIAIQQGLPFAPADALDVPTFDPGAQALASGGPAQSGGFFATAGTTTATAAVPAGLAFTRSASQVLQIVYGAAGKTGVSKGGFFPNGLNGNITVT